MVSANKKVYVLSLRGQPLCETQRYIEFLDNKYSIQKLEFDNEKELVEKALSLLMMGESIIITAELSNKNIEKILSETNPRRQFTAFNTIKTHQQR